VDPYGRAAAPGQGTRRPSNAVQLDPNGCQNNTPPKTPQQRLPIVIAAIANGDAECRVTLAEYKGALTIDVRLFEPLTMARAPMPTGKGVTLGLPKLPELARALAEAEATARAMGLLDGGG
jgi:hypothetical protein